MYPEHAVTCYGCGQGIEGENAHQFHAEYAAHSRCRRRAAVAIVEVHRAHRANVLGCDCVACRIGRAADVEAQRVLEPGSAKVHALVTA